MRLAGVLWILAAAAVLPASVSAQTSSGASAGQAKPAPPARTVITDPDWAIRPRPEYPEAAMSDDIRRGRVDLECRVGENGPLSGCEILSEQPEGVGFGRAALRAAAGASINPVLAADLAPDTIVRFAVTFAMN